MVSLTHAYSRRLTHAIYLPVLVVLEDEKETGFSVIVIFIIFFFYRDAVFHSTFSPPFNRLTEIIKKHQIKFHTEIFIILVKKKTQSIRVIIAWQRNWEDDIRMLWRLFAFGVDYNYLFHKRKTVTYDLTKNLFCGDYVRLIKRDQRKSTVHKN